MEEKKDRDDLFRLIGRAEAFHSLEGMSRIARVHALKRIRDEKLYKGIPGCNTMRDVFTRIGVSKTTGYEELDALERLGGDVMELLFELGVSSQDAYLLGRGSAGEIEDVPFEVIDAEAGTVRVEGKELRVQDAPEVVSQAIQKALNTLRLHRQAIKGLEEDLKKEREETKRLGRKIDVGEQQVRELKARAERATSGKQIVTATGELLAELLMLTNRFLETEVTEEDQPYISHYLDVIDAQRERLLEKYRHYLPEDGI